MSINPAALLSSQKRRLIKLTVQTESDYELVLDSFTGSESISEPFSFELALLSRDPFLELKTLIDQPTLLEIELVDGAQRNLHGHITAFNHLKSDGGLSYYSATLSPWLWYLSQRIDSRIFQDCTVLDVLNTVFAHYGALAVFRFDLAQPSALRVHSCITQFNETDQQFVRRLLEEEGLLFYFEHTAKGHTLVVSDYSHSLTPLAQQPIIRFHQEALPASADTISEWTAHRLRQSDAIRIPTFDYKQASAWELSDMRSLSAANERLALEHYVFAGQHSAGSSDEAARRVVWRAEALHALGKTFRGVSNCRAMVPGYTFELTQHPRHEGQLLPDRRQQPEPRTSVKEFLLLCVQHSGRNNYLNDDDEAVYRNTFTCLRRHIPYRPACETPRPVMAGPLTAIVVGEKGLGEVQTDEWARVKVRFHWQREQPDETGTDKRHAQDTAWLRVSQPSAGEGFGHQFMPRIGQEVVVSFVAGDINRPLVTGAVYNSAHRSPRFSNAGDYKPLPGNNALSGIKTKEHQGAGYSELLFDDTPGELRTRLATDHQDSALNLGKLTTPRNEGKAQPLGNGAELRTNAAIALRAAQGLLLSTYAKHQAQDNQLGREALLELLERCADLFKSLGETATAQGAQVLDHAGIDRLQQSLKQWPAPDSSASGEPLIALTGEAGIVSATPASQAHYAGENFDTTAQDHLQMTSGAAMRLHAGKGISAFAQDEGISAIANRGKVLVQAQDDDIALNAQKNLHASAAEGEIVLTAPTIRLVADDGSYVKIGGGIEIGTSGSAIVHAADHDWVGAKTDSVAMPVFGRQAADQRLLFHYPGHTGDSSRLATDHEYKINLEDGTDVSGVTDSTGLTQIVERQVMHKASVAAVRAPQLQLLSGSRAGPSGNQTDKYSEQFHVVTPGAEHLPKAGQRYRISAADGRVWEGVTDADGLTERVYTDAPVALTFETLRDNDGEVIQ